jgi:gluconate 2-dehydrogenase gamma chain
MNSFFDRNYQSPSWYQQKIERRQLLKSAAGASAIAATPTWVLAQAQLQQLATLQQSDPWRTLGAVLEHLFPASSSGPSAQDIHALAYLYQVVTVQPIGVAEQQFITQGVTWLNSYSQSELQKHFVQADTNERETLLRAISQSQAGDNWLSTLINYLLEALLAPPIYGGNPNGIGWHWLEHQAGFPLPKAGDRYYEIPGSQQIQLKIIPSEPVATERKDSRKS